MTQDTEIKTNSKLTDLVLKASVATTKYFFIKELFDDGIITQKEEDFKVLLDFYADEMFGAINNLLDELNKNNDQ